MGLTALFAIIKFLADHRKFWLPIGLVYLFFSSLEYSKLMSNNLIAPGFINQFYELLIDHSILTNILGPLSLVMFFGVGIYKNWHLVKDISKAIWNRSTHLPDHLIQGQQRLPLAKAQENLIEFSIGANNIDIFAGDADFVTPDNPQYEELLGNANRLRMLVKRGDKRNIEHLHQLSKSSAMIRAYSFNTDSQGLRGRICNIDSGRKACLLTQNGNNASLEILTNNAAVGILSGRFDRLYERGLDPFVKHLLFDTTDIIFDINYHEFFNAVSASLGVTIQNSPEERSSLLKHISTSRCAIEDAIASVHNLHLSDEIRINIKKLWINNWRINQELLEILHNLKNIGYSHYLSGISDRHMHRYIVDNDHVDNFDGLLTTIDIGHSKLDDNYLSKICETLNSKPFEIALVDDDLEYTRHVAQLGIKTIHISKKGTQEEKANRLHRKLVESRLCAKTHI